MAKTAGGDSFLLEKGEKVGLGIGAGVGVLLLALGVMQLGGSQQSPQEYANAVDTKAKQLNQDMAKKEATIPPVPEVLQKTGVASALPVTPDNHALFDPTSPPDWRRITPIVMTVAEGQVDTGAVKILAND